MMEQVVGESLDERLYRKALEVRYERRVGLWMPMIWHLALRGHTDAMIVLANSLAHDDSISATGKPADAFSAAGLYRRAYRKGNGLAARNLALGCFNRNDMVGYRQWLRRAAKAGDIDSGRERSHFETRLWHNDAKKIGRLRPWQKRDAFA